MARTVQVVQAVRVVRAVRVATRVVALVAAAVVLAAVAHQVVGNDNTKPIHHFNCFYTQTNLELKPTPLHFQIRRV